ncbi:MAG: type II toxin-antitoxin system VapC family toxin [Leptospiraceae bacterium]|nr:type II toxin-antitoxin system VapC family toxin [Leptospiraceae bacterium]
MNVLLDTHIFLWSILDPEKIPAKSLNCIMDTKNELYLSFASVWEMTIKQSLNKLHLDTSIKGAVEESIFRYGLRLLSLQTEHIYNLENLPYHHKDPFDRILLSQCQIENMVLVSDDSIFKKYKIKLISN